ncbi:MAG TPA: DUF559 domain-containing protein [Candidatus Saccharimonadales bacterium]|nr:DUF559 domain-containing protein [Candidatus Saccharimonadales bacterium]
MDILIYNKTLKARANFLRKNSTKAERVLWITLQKRKLLNLRFNRQKMIGNYILDFYCKELKLAIEVDDISHDLKYDYDERRTIILNTLDITILRFSNEDILKNIDGVVESIKQYVLRNYRLE